MRLLSDIIKDEFEKDFTSDELSELVEFANIADVYPYPCSTFTALVCDGEEVSAKLISKLTNVVITRCETEYPGQRASVPYFLSRKKYNDSLLLRFVASLNVCEQGLEYIVKYDSDLDVILRNCYRREWYRTLTAKLDLGNDLYAELETVNYNVKQKFKKRFLVELADFEEHERVQNTKPKPRI